MMTKEMVLAMVAECDAEEKKTEMVPVFYKRHGKMVRRSYDDRKYTARYEELFFDREEKTLRSEEAKIFRCADCGRLVGYWDLEAWVCDFDEDDYLCSECYEDSMGEDL